VDWLHACRGCLTSFARPTTCPRTCSQS
jgi:hypothetical protein